MAPDVYRVTRREFLVACGLTAAGCGTSATALRPIVGDDPYRLPSTVIPKRYELRMAPDFASRRFSGRVVIEVAVGAPVTEIVLNAELRVPIRGPVGGVVFVDGGNVFVRAADIDLSDLRGSVGFGARYRSPIGPIRIDMGFKLDRRVIGAGLEPRFAFHFSIGQAF